MSGTLIQIRIVADSLAEAVERLGTIEPALRPNDRIEYSVEAAGIRRVSGFFGTSSFLTNWRAWVDELRDAARQGVVTPGVSPGGPA